MLKYVFIFLLPKSGISYFLKESWFFLLGNGILRLKFDQQQCSLSWIAMARNIKFQKRHVFTVPNKIWNFRPPFQL